MPRTRARPGSATAPASGVPARSTSATCTAQSTRGGSLNSRVPSRGSTIQTRSASSRARSSLASSDRMASSGIGVGRAGPGSGRWPGGRPRPSAWRARRRRRSGGPGERRAAHRRHPAIRSASAWSRGSTGTARDATARRRVRPVPLRRPPRPHDAVRTCGGTRASGPATSAGTPSACTAATVWFTGLSGSGKSTVAVAVEDRLLAAGRPTYLLDGDNLRHGLNGDLGFSAEDRHENVRRVGEVARLFADAGVVGLVPLISPYRVDRDPARVAHEAAGLPLRRGVRRHADRAVRAAGPQGPLHEGPGRGDHRLHRASTTRTRPPRPPSWC